MEAVLRAAASTAAAGDRNTRDKGETMSRDVRQVLRILSALAFATIGTIAISMAGLTAHAQQAVARSSSPVTEAPKGKAFTSPEAAAAALYAAARRNDEVDLMVVLGPEAKEILSWSDDNAADRQARRERFAQKYDQMHRLVKEPDDTIALYVGAENWPFPIPIVEYNGRWYFDTELGKQEVLYRRVGRNEIEALQVCRALVDAEKDYYAGAHQYTEKFVSSDGAHDGLYWQATNGTNNSPIGPHLARAGVSETSGEGRRPYHGYYYRILLSGSSGSSVQQGKTGGFAVVAFPADYRVSGVMTFIVDQDENAHEKDLGPSTATLAKQISSYNPDSSWKKVE
jgi:Protein of unknown function (DUF2950)